ncbi:CAT2 [Cyberlindnera jadinii]|uniref:Carnitine O-acetyltransferase, mitochondrial n=2 Tax=Cyberlindnera jadinii TaxID=4903 RepID=A0A0H5C8K0_CYBJN|nr:carnitine acetyltransferase [Cyberlindnera jadinii]CEP24626.1 CAT2 [Cyberlindnera jadinii]
MFKRMGRKFSTYAPKFKGETYKFQDQLPSLPVPTLEATRARYLKSIKPFVASEQEYKEHEALVDDFFKTQAPALQERLTELQATSRNWLSKYWDDYAYLQYNDPVVPYVSYYYGHKPLPHELRSIGKNQLYKTVAIIEKVTDFIELLKNETLPPEVIRGTPYCMKSFQVMFNNSRYPKELGQDSNVFYSLEENGFVVVIKNNHFFKLYTHKGQERLPSSEVHKQLIDIVRIANGLPKGKAVGALTTLPRDQWFHAYQELNKSPINVASITDIHKSAFIITLEDEQPVTYEDRAHFAWHGNGENRFFDKPIQFFVAKNGYSAFIAEHSKMDGTPTLLLNEVVNRELHKLNPQEFLKSLEFGISEQGSVEAKHLRFEVSPVVESAIANAKANFKSEIDNHDVSVFHYNKYGKNQIKQFKTSPDAFIQMIIQLGFYKMSGTVWPTYEAASTRKFYGGRTEATRSVSEESLRFVQNWENPSVSDAQRAVDFQEAVKSHMEYIRAASNGEGCDRHLLGLKFQLKDGEKPHPLFSDPLFNYSSTWLISTSQLSSNYHDAYGWSEVNPIGWGLAYQVNNDFLHINVCTRRSSGNDSKTLRFYLEEAATEIFEVLIKQQKPKL